MCALVVRGPGSRSRAACESCTQLSIIYLSICRRDLQDLAEAPRGRGAPWLELPWGEVRAALQLEHAVPGGLSEEEREGLFEEEAKRAREGRPRTRVDVSDLGLTMDDLTGPMGGT